MTQSELIHEVSRQRGISKTTIAAILKTVGDVIALALAGGAEEVSLPGVGKFHAIDKAERPGRNPRTGEVVTICARRVPTFSPSKSFKALVDR